MKSILKVFFLPLLLPLAGCYPTPGPDKSASGALLGAAWGAGTGAIIGNQVGGMGTGALIGMGFGAGAGLLTGIGLDTAEGEELAQQRELDAVRLEVQANRHNLAMLQNQFDNYGKVPAATPSSLDIFFDPDRASLRLGSAAELERFAKAVKYDSRLREIQIHGHSDDTGNADRNQKLSEARARTVQTFLAEHGISLDTIKVVPHSASQPLAANDSEAGRQLNRRVEVVLFR